MIFRKTGWNTTFLCLSLLAGGCARTTQPPAPDEVSRLLNAWFGPEVTRVEVQIGGNCPSCIYTIEQTLVNAGVNDQQYLALLMAGKARARILQARLLASAPSLAPLLGRRILIIDSIPKAFRGLNEPVAWFRRVDSLHWQQVPFGQE